MNVKAVAGFGGAVGCVWGVEEMGGLAVCWRGISRLSGEGGGGRS